MSDDRQPLKPLAPEMLCRHCDPSEFTFETTAELDDLTDVVGQTRAVEAIEFAMGMRQDGYNVYVLGPTGSGKHAIVRRLLRAKAAGQAVPDDWCYVYNFDRTHKPEVLKLPAGTGAQLRAAVEALVSGLQTVIPAVFESDDYRNKRQAIQNALKQRQEAAFATVQKEAVNQQVSIAQSEAGLVFAPVENGEVIPAETFNALPETEREAIQTKIRKLQEMFGEIMRQVPAWAREAQESLAALDSSVSEIAVKEVTKDIRTQFSALPQVLAFMDAMEADIVQNVALFRATEQENGPPQPGGPQRASEDNPTKRRYAVNLLVDRQGLEGAPVVYADNPTYQELFGSIEHVAEFGTLLTDFGRIKAGALHRANGGYLILDTRKLLMQPHVWEGLKQALRSGEIRIESPGQTAGVISTVSLSPAPIPLDVKVLLIGERRFYYMLDRNDPDFAELFKVTADFDDQVERNVENNLNYARILAGMARKESLHPISRAGVARLLEYSARLSGDAEKLSTHVRRLNDLVRESDFYTGRAGHDRIEAEDVDQAIDAATHRLSRMQSAMQEQIIRGTVLIDTAGAAVGQINALSVLQLGRFAFGKPSRITARLRMGAGKVVDIEREVDLGGPLHSKGVMILGGYLGSRYAPDHPLALSASLVFEQSYGGVDGDSASSTELYALLSALSDIPIKQCLAVTGAVNQNGGVQAIGGVNEKIEGFFDICSSRGLTGEEGVLIPQTNVKNLMLRRDVVEAVSAGKFRIFPVSTIDEGIEVLTGVPAGQRDDAGAFPADSINGKVEARLIELAEKRRSWASRKPNNNNKGAETDD
jgi:lon-related putative ATP-dependent protease